MIQPYDEYNSITEAEIEAALAKAVAEDMKGARDLSGHYTGINLTGWKVYNSWSNLTIQKSPLLLTRWGQGTTGAYSGNGYAYNNLVKLYAQLYDNSTKTYTNTYGNQNFVTGCGTTAVAQIIVYNNYINSYAGGKLAAFNLSNVGTWSGSYNFSLIRTMPTITNASSAASAAAARGQVAHLMYQIGRIANAKYTPSAAGINIDDAKRVFETFGYTITNYAYATTVSDSPLRPCRKII